MLHHFLLGEIQQENQQCRIKAKGKSFYGCHSNKSSLVLLTSVVCQRRSKCTLTFCQNTDLWPALKII